MTRLNLVRKMVTYYEIGYYEGDDWIEIQQDKVDEKVLEKGGRQ